MSEKRAELLKLIKNGESARIEFKRSTGRRTDAAKAVCSMLNGEGGYVFFGVSDKGQLPGQEVSDTTIIDVVQELRRIEPPAFPELEEVKLENGQSILAVNVPEGDDLYSYDGRSYIRHGPTTSVMPREEYQRRLMEKVHAQNRWENQPVPDGVSVRDLDEGEILTTVEEAIRLGQLDPSIRRDVETILRGLELTRGDKLLNAAVVLYGKSDQLINSAIERQNILNNLYAVEEIKKATQIKGIKFENKTFLLKNQIAAAVAKEYGTYPKMILRAHSKKREAQQVLIELSYRLNFRKKSLTQLGEELGVGGDSIAHTHQRIQKKMKEDEKLSRRVNRIYQEIISQ